MRPLMSAMIIVVEEHIPLPMGISESITTFQPGQRPTPSLMSRLTVLLI